MYKQSVPQKVAVSVEYQEGKNPEVTASGVGKVAKLIIDIAQAHNVPIHTDADLAKLLAAEQPGEILNVKAKEVVLEILSFLYEVDAHVGAKGKITVST